MTSSSERSDVTAALQAAGLRPVPASGAGYKLLQVALGSAVGFVVSLSSTFLWDTCGPDALLRSLGGSLTFTDGSAIRYDRSGDSRNTGCLVATLDDDVRQRVLDALGHCGNV
ncbi:putative inositol monophosphatase 3 [Pollicipes pollicipes]|uniref:putative inositol monophosphatase 3 n=1 Tax=Pollicipes pollicipes TaxID=41117 RepID=UPI001884C7C2|nr:putative inositol monophosphatase 3 [Pollicipes pollicipes]